MRYLVIGILAGLLGLAAAWPKDAGCVYCPTYVCYNSASCGYGCTCITPPGSFGGRCWGVQ